MSAYGAQASVRDRRAHGRPAGADRGSVRPRALARFANRQGMTLPEILAAIAILSILFALLIMPIMKAFGYIHTSNIKIEVQTAGRTAFESIVREVSDAVYIYDNVDDPTLGSLIFVLPQGAGVNANQDPPPANGEQTQLLLQPGPGIEYGTGVPVHVIYQSALARPGVVAADGSVTSVLPYWNGWELENQDLRNSGLDAGLAMMKDNLYRLFRGEFFPSVVDPATRPAGDPALARYLSTAIGEAPGDAYGFDRNQPDQFREPGWLFDDSIYSRKPKDAGTAALACSLAVANRRSRLERRGLLTPVTPNVGVDTAWATYTPPAQTGTGQGAWAAQSLVKFETLSVSNEALDAVTVPGQIYPSTYRADYGHWQWKRRKDWSHPAYGTSSELDAWARYFQTFDVQVRRRYDHDNNNSTPAITASYYVSLGRDDSTPTTAAKDDDGDGDLDPHYLVWRATGSTPSSGVWPAADRPTFDSTRYKAMIDTFRRGEDWETSATTPVDFWTANNPYDTRLLPTMTGGATDSPYWPEMAYLLDIERGAVEFRVDAPVRIPKDTVQPAGPLAPFQAPYGVPADGQEYVAPPGGGKSDWVIKDVDRAAGSSTYGNTDRTTWIRIAPETMRVMVGTPRDPADLTKGYTWRSYTRTTERNLLRDGEFCFDSLNGLLSFDPDETTSWNANIKIRAWYQLQTNVQRASNTRPLTSTDGMSVTASYFTKEVLHLTLGLRGYDQDTGRAQPFQLTATIRPRNLR